MAAGILPAVEPGVPPGGQYAHQCNGRRKYLRCWKIRTLIPGGKMPPSTSGGTPDATSPVIPLLSVAAEAANFLAVPNRDDQPADSTPPDPLVSGLHFRGKLPHLKKEGAVYFVTYRLNDSLPAHEVARLKHERRVILEQARAAKSPLTWHEEEQLLAWYPSITGCAMMPSMRGWWRTSKATR